MTEATARKLTTYDVQRLGHLHGGNVNVLRVRLAPAQPLMREEDKYLAAPRGVSDVGHRIVNNDIVP